MAYDAGKLSLITQGITGNRLWVYYDTGGETAATFKGASFITDAGEFGADSGDEIFVIDAKAGIGYRGYINAVSDTGSGTFVGSDTA